MKKDEADAKSVCLIFAFMGSQSVASQRSSPLKKGRAEGAG